MERSRKLGGKMSVYSDYRVASAEVDPRLEARSLEPLLDVQ